MIELIRTDDPVLVSWLQARLGELGVEVFVFDAHTSSVYGGALNTIGRRVMIAEDDLAKARPVLAEVRELAGKG